MKANLSALRALPLAALLMVLGSCAAPAPKPHPQPMPPPVVHPRPAPVVRPGPPPANWRDMPATPGDWSWRGDGALSVASFGERGQASLLSLTCDAAARQVVLRRQATASGPFPLSIATTTRSGVLTALPEGGTGMIAVALRPADPLLDAIAFSRGRFMVEGPGLATLYVPSWPEISRVIEDCR